jgi:CheY-like chemotaxis protein
MTVPILLIDDDPDTRDILRALLEWKHYHVVECSSAEEGLRAAKEGRPAVVVTEFLIPALGHGRCFVEELRQDPLTADLPAIVFTSNRLPEAAHRIRLAGAEFVAKPGSPRAVLRVIERLAAACPR